MNQINPDLSWREYCKLNGLSPRSPGRNTFYRGSNKTTFDEGRSRTFWNPVKIPCLDEKSREVHRLTYVVSHGGDKHGRGSYEDYYNHNSNNNKYHHQQKRKDREQHGAGHSKRRAVVLGSTFADLSNSDDVKYGPRAFHLPHRPLIAPPSARESRSALQGIYGGGLAYLEDVVMFVPARGDQYDPKTSFRREDAFNAHAYVEDLRRRRAMDGYGYYGGGGGGGGDEDEKQQKHRRERKLRRKDSGGRGYGGYERKERKSAWGWRNYFQAPSVRVY